uniref:Uncharacterized protein n=1 Tax=Cacopsylla melanoneura TaxID=428564 RepID=A0A8D9ATT4_9HEMI
MTGPTVEWTFYVTKVKKASSLIQQCASCNQAKEVDQEKKSIYEPCIPYFKENFNLKDVKVIGLLIGARGAMTLLFEEFRRNFNLPKSILKEITIAAVRGSCKIIHNHLYKNT